MYREIKTYIVIRTGSAWVPREMLYTEEDFKKEYPGETIVLAMAIEAKTRYGAIREAKRQYNEMLNR